jgi:hypothetical protein
MTCKYGFLSSWTGPWRWALRSLKVSPHEGLFGGGGGACGELITEGLFFLPELGGFEPQGLDLVLEGFDGWTLGWRDLALGRGGP